MVLILYIYFLLVYFYILVMNVCDIYLFNNCVWSLCNFLKCDIVLIMLVVFCVLYCSGNCVVKWGIISLNYYVYCDNIYNIDNSIWMVICVVCFLCNYEFVWFWNWYEMLCVGRIVINVCGMWSGIFMSCFCLLFCNY